MLLKWDINGKERDRVAEIRIVGIMGSRVRCLWGALTHTNPFHL